MKTWRQLREFNKSGKHIRLVGPAQADLERLCTEETQASKLRYLTLAGNVRGYKITDFSVLGKLPYLEELYLEDRLTQEGLQQISTLVSLKELHIYHAGKVTNLEPLRHLKNLSGLSITTPAGWLGKLLHLPTSRPIENLNNLEYLNLAGIFFDQDGIEPITKLDNLKQVYLIKQYQEELKTTAGR